MRAVKVTRHGSQDHLIPDLFWPQFAAQGWRRFGDGIDASDLSAPMALAEYERTHQKASDVAQAASEATPFVEAAQQPLGSHKPEDVGRHHAPQSRDTRPIAAERNQGSPSLTTAGVTPPGADTPSFRKLIADEATKQGWCSLRWSEEKDAHGLAMGRLLGVAPSESKPKRARK
jgi:hypothetical protein